MTDIASLRRVMVESQVQTNDVTDRRLLRAMLDCPREAFAPGVDPSVAYLDGEVELQRGLPGQSGRVLLQPMLIGKLLQLAKLREGDKVLVVGSATGYIAALCSALAKSVVALESEASLATIASEVFARLGLGNIKSVTGPLAAGASADAPFDVIIVGGRVGDVPELLAKQLADHGRMVSVIGGAVIGRATLTERHGATTTSRGMFDAQASELPGFSRKPAFAL